MTKRANVRWEVLFLQKSAKEIEEGVLKDQLRRIAGAATRNKARGLKASIPRTIKAELVDGMQTYSAPIVLTKVNSQNQETAQRYFDEATNQMRKAAEMTGWFRQGEEPFAGPADFLLEYVPKIETFPALTPSVMKSVFGRIYERDPHIRTIYSAMQTAIESDFKVRHHIVLHGPPACAKSEICRDFMAWLNADERIVMPLDTTTTTKAGLERLLYEGAKSQTLPPFLYLEEIEKYKMEILLCLLQVMDGRGTIQRTNARVGNIRAKCPIMIIATCNSLSTLKAFADGALWSRFNHKLYCGMPDRPLMQKILERDGQDLRMRDDSVIEKILAFAFDELGCRDAREITAYLDGCNRIDSFIADQRTIFQSLQKDRALAIPPVQGA